MTGGGVEDGPLLTDLVFPYRLLDAGGNSRECLMLLHPGIIRRAALLRPMPVLDKVPTTDLAGIRTLIIAGAADETYGPFAPALVTLLSRHGSEIDARIIPSGHEIGDPDAAIVR